MKTGAAVLPLARSTGRVLLGLRAPPCADPYTWAAFGGETDPEDATLADTALRELAEETGYRGPIRLVFGVNNKIPGVRAHTFVGAVPREFEPEINWEHVMTAWVDPWQLDRTQLFWAAQQFFDHPQALALLAAIARPSGRRP